MGDDDEQDHGVPREGNAVETTEGHRDPGMGRLEARNASQQEGRKFRCHVT